MTHFGDELRQARLAAKLSQNELARRSGVNVGTINRLEAGEREPTGPEQVTTLAAALELAGPGHDRLLAAAGFMPDAVARLGPADATLVLVASILADESLPARERADFRAQIALAARRWRPDTPLPGPLGR